MAEFTPPHTHTSPPTRPTADDSAAEGYRISLIKGDERWHFHWTPGDETTLIARVAELARDDQFTFDWHDAAIVCKHIAQPWRVADASHEI